MKKFKFVFGAVIIVLLLNTASAQATPKVDKRQAIQEKRIDQGVSNGTLSKRETRKLDQQQWKSNT
jgi:hypothetical protein